MSTILRIALSAGEVPSDIIFNSPSLSPAGGMQKRYSVNIESSPHSTLPARSRRFFGPMPTKCKSSSSSFSCDSNRMLSFSTEHDLNPLVIGFGFGFGFELAPQPPLVVLPMEFK